MLHKLPLHMYTIVDPHEKIIMMQKFKVRSFCVHDYFFKLLLIVDVSLSLPLPSNDKTYLCKNMNKRTYLTTLQSPRGDRPCGEASV
jgi:hypothetical protein